MAAAGQLVLVIPLLIISLLFFLPSGLAQEDPQEDRCVVRSVTVKSCRVRHAANTTIPAPSGGGEKWTYSAGRPTTRCPIHRVVKVGAGCVDGLVTMIHKRNINGLLSGARRPDAVDGPVQVDPGLVKQCCSVLGGEQLDFDTSSDCLCSSLKLKALDLKAYVPLAAHLLASCRANTTSTAQVKLLPKFTCSPID